MAHLRLPGFLLAALCFGAVTCAKGAGLAGTSWQVHSYNDGKQGVAILIQGTRISADFGKEGRVTGSAGCNGYFAHFETSGETIRVGPPAATRKYCIDPRGLMEQEMLYLQSLHTATTFRIEGDQLTLRRADGAVAVILLREQSELASKLEVKIRFDLDRLDPEGLQGPRDGLRSLHYEYCIPDRRELIRKVTAIDPTLEIQRSARGRIGCASDELLCLGHTHQAGYRSVLERLAALDAIAEIRESFFE